MESDAAMTEDLIPYNIIPLDVPTIANAIVSLPEVQASVSSLRYFRDLPKLPGNFVIPATRNADILDFLQYVFGFQWQERDCNWKNPAVAERKGTPTVKKKNCSAVTKSGTEKEDAERCSSEQQKESVAAVELQQDSEERKEEKEDAEERKV
ncbi:hypothetical protein U1Q18_032112 [Sarracenia purpurea var. burkii]